MDQPTMQNDEYRFHTPVMLDEVIAWLEPAATGWVVDGTFGGGGHSRALLDRYPNIRVVGVDRDPDALAEAPRSERLVLVQGNYRNIDSIAGVDGVPALFDGILLDLGVSSHQLDQADRGFSYRRNGPLDMRMGDDATTTAADIVNERSESDLAWILSRYGEERFARRIAAAIIRQRPFEDTDSLSACISDAVPAAVRRSGHPARKSFQAIRIAVNDELGGLEEVMGNVYDLLAPGGRIVVIAYHSLEDRIVKNSMKERSAGCTCPPELPICTCSASPDVRMLTRKPQRPTDTEVARNARARSGRLRVAEKVVR